MKNNYYYILFVLLIFSVSSVKVWGQIPNAGFENWTNGNPDSWETDNSPLFSPITQTSDSHSGSSAMEGSVVTYMGVGITPTADISFPYTGQPAALTGYYKLNTSNNDSLVITVVLYKNGNGIAGGYFSAGKTATSYTQFSANLYYANPVAADSCTIAIVIFPATGAQSTTQFKLDDLGFSNAATAVNKSINRTPESFELFNNYPNPFNPTTNVTYQLPERSFVTLRVFNVLGKLVSTLVNGEQPSGKYSVQFNATNLPSGVYYCALQAGSYYKVNKMILLK